MPTKKCEARRVRSQQTAVVACVLFVGESGRALPAQYRTPADANDVLHDEKLEFESGSQKAHNSTNQLANRTMMTIEQTKETKDAPYRRASCILLLVFAVTVVGHQLYLENTFLRWLFGAEPQATSLCPQLGTKNVPIPVIAISLGRSGSSSTWQILGNLTGEESPHDEKNEYTGGNFDKNKEFFKNNKDETWLIDVMCERMMNRPSAGIVGFKWKLEPRMLKWPGVKAAFRFLKDTRALPSIKIVRSRRNLLDFTISSYKRSAKKLPPHCRKTDTDCVEKLHAASSGITLPTKGLVRSLRQKTKKENAVDKYLVRSGIPHVSVTYERLYGNIFGDNEAAVAEWRRVFEFVGRGPTRELTFAQLQHATGKQATNYPFHNITLQNYEEVRKTLAGTEFEGLLH